MKVERGWFIKTNDLLEHCPWCPAVCKLTRHHVFPKRWGSLWTTKQKRESVRICRRCHDTIETEIHDREKAVRGPLPVEEYLEIARVVVTKAA